MDETYKTSQKEWSLAEGQNSAGPGAVQYASETSGVPGPVTEPIKGEIMKIDAMSTSQQNEHSDPAGK